MTSSCAYAVTPAGNKAFVLAAAAACFTDPRKKHRYYGRCKCQTEYNFRQTLRRWRVGVAHGMLTASRCSREYGPIYHGEIESMHTASLSEMFQRLIRADGQSRAAKTVEYFGWLMLFESAVLLFAPHFVWTLTAWRAQQRVASPGPG